MGKLYTVELTREELLAVTSSAVLISKEIEDGNQKTNTERKEALDSGLGKLLAVVAIANDEFRKGVEERRQE